MQTTSGNSIIRQLRESDTFAAFVFDFVDASGTDAYLVGGAVRDHFFEVVPNDLDLLIPNADMRLYSHLDDRGFPFRENRHGNRRYFVGDRSFDVMMPANFYRPWDTAQEAIAYFDVSINAVGVRLADGALFDAWGGIEDIRDRRIRPTPERWNDMTGFESAHLVLRLLRYAQRYDLRLADPEVVARHVHSLDAVDWNDVTRYHDLGRDEARQALQTLLGSRFCI